MGSKKKELESKVPLYRSAFNSDYRSSVSYSVENYYEETPKHQDYTKKMVEEQQSAAVSITYESINDDEEDLDTTKPSTKLTGYVGFANLPNQVYWKAAQKGFEFTLMVVGSSGLGKSTLINSLFLTDIYDSTSYPGPTARSKSTVSVEITRVRLKESGVKLTLTLVDTPGFGDALNNDECWIPITNYIDEKYEEYFVSENKVNRKSIQDQRVHCCLYFIEPTGHSLKLLDIEFMKRLSDKVNIIPVIGKADTLTPEECSAFKKQICRDIEDNNIKIYEFPDLPEDDEEYKLNKSLKERVPFAVVGSNNVVEVDGKIVRGRQYSWGVIDIENLEHCDFIALRQMLISMHMQDLKDTTHNVHYENYRCRKLISVMGDKNYSKKNPLIELDEERQEHETKLEHLKKDMEEHFNQKVVVYEKSLRDTERLLKMRLDSLRKAIEEDNKELEIQRKQFKIEKEVWEKEILNTSGTAECKKEKKKGSFF